MRRKKSVVNEELMFLVTSRGFFTKHYDMEEKSIVDEALKFFAAMGGFFTKHKSSSLRSMKRREVVFSPRAKKRYVHRNFMHRKEMNYKTTYILHSKPMSSKYYKHSPTNVTLIF
jgi:hypothetical protein